MFKIKQTDLKAVLNVLKPGVNKTISEMSSCVHFREDCIVTESPLLYVTVPLISGIDAVVSFEKLFKIVSQFSAGDTIQMASKKKTLGIKVVDKKKTLQFAVHKHDPPLVGQSLEIPENWKDLPDDFTVGLSGTYNIANKASIPSETSNCINITAEHITAVDGSRGVRYYIPTGFGTPALLPAGVIKDLLKIHPTKVARKDKRVFFSNKSGVVYSIAEFLAKFPETEHLFTFDIKHVVETDNSFYEMIQAAAALDAHQVILGIKKGVATITAPISSSPIHGTCVIKYDGKPFTINVRTNHLLDGLQYSNAFGVNEKATFLLIATDSVAYLSALVLE